MKYRNEWLQLGLFLGLYGVLHFAYFRIPDAFLVEVIYFQGLGRVASGLINALAPGEGVSAVQNHILSARANLAIIRGCDGAGSLFLLLSAILAFPTSFKSKLAGLLLGATLMYGLNMARICALYFILVYRPAWFTAVHIYLAPSLIVLLACLFFAWWIGGSGRRIHAAI